MSDTKPTREQLLDDVVELRGRVALLEQVAVDQEQHFRCVVDGSPS